MEKDVTSIIQTVSNALLLLTWIGNRSDKFGNIEFDLKIACEELGITIRSYQRMMKKLINCGAVDVISRPTNSSGKTILKVIYLISIKNLEDNIVTNTKTNSCDEKDWRLEIKNSIKDMDDSVFIKKFVSNYKPAVLFTGMEKRFSEINKVVETWNRCRANLLTLNISRFKSIYKTLDLVTAEQLKYAVELYSEVLKDDKCFYTYEFSFDRFIEPNSGKFEGFVNTKRENFLSFDTNNKRGFDVNKGMLTHEAREKMTDEEYEADMKKYEGKDW